MFSWFRKRNNKKQSECCKYFYCKTFRALPPETIFDVAGRKYQKTWSDKAKDLETGEEKWINTDILCIVYLEDKNV